MKEIDREIYEYGEVERLTARVRELEAALEPFAIASRLYPREDEDVSVLVGFNEDQRLTIKVGDLNTARAVLTKGETA